MTAIVPSAAPEATASRPRLRIAINTGNAATVRRADDGSLAGPAIALAAELCDSLGCTGDIVPFASAGDIIKAELGGEAWDVALLAIDPQRAERLHFSVPYMTIEATFAVRADTDIDRCDAIDRDDIRIATSEGAAYDLTLRRLVRSARLISFASPALAFAGFLEQELESAVGVRDSLVKAAAGRTDIRILPDTFFTIAQSVAVPRTREAAWPAIEAFMRQKYA